MKILVIGCGSIGKRHIKNLIKLKGVEILACDTDKKKIEEVKSVSKRIRTSRDVNKLWEEKPDAVFITLPTSLHIKQALRAAKKGCHLFIEKPLSHNMTGIKELMEIVKRKKLVTYVGYSYRFNDCLGKIKKLLDKESIGKVVSGRLHFGSYLPARHPWEDYRKGYGARKSLGGGVVLDAVSHQLNLITFLFGMPKEVLWSQGKRSRLEIDVEDTSEVMTKFTDGKVISMYADFVQRPHKNTMEIIGDKGTIFCDFVQRKVKSYNAQTGKWTEYKGKKDANSSYEEEIKHFLTSVRKKKPTEIDVIKAGEEMELLTSIKRKGSGIWKKG